MPVNAIVLGNGRSGRAAAELLRREGAHVVVLDGDAAWPGGMWDMCVTSPGIPLGHPWQTAARAAGIPFIHASYGFGKAAHPDAVIHAPLELPEVLKNL